MSVQYHGKLPHHEKSTWDHLVQAAQGDALSAYISDHGYGEIFGVLEHLDHMDSQTFMNFLEMQLQKEKTAAGTVKRDSHRSYHDTLTNYHHDYYEHLSRAEKRTWDGLTNAAKTDTVTAYISSIGYGPIFGLLEHLDYNHGNDFMDSLEYQLQKEAANAA
ncbi:uncharacterized protein LOC101861883 [Aplysia californica]|uniref:Uncharacterized protein LOC101861883 n=1 Tax=Aplysia californica TaxID=6500 RepID=A0ABM0ZXJ9_APLCA|nr:uncharacterized protein LOC101861883 [Aplysia californica]